MITFDSLCSLVAIQSTSSVLLHQACTLPRSPADPMPLPLPRAEFAFDSSWEAIFAGTESRARSAERTEILDDGDQPISRP